MKYLFLVILCLNVFALEFKSEDSVSINVSGGNTNLKTYILKTENSLKHEKNFYGLKLKYRYGESSDVTVAENWDLEFRYERNLSKTLIAYVGEKVQANRFKGFKRRYNTDIGPKWIAYKTDQKTLNIEAGYRYSIEEKEDESLADTKSSKGRLYIEWLQKLSEDLSVKFWSEYLPNFSKSDDYQLSFGPSLTANLTKILAIKSSYQWEYDNLPIAGKGRHDYVYLLSLLAKF